MSWPRTMLPCERAGAAVEMAIVAPVFVALLFAAFQGGLMLWTQIGLQHATERAARCAAIDASLCGSADLVKAYAVTQALAAKIPDSSFTLSSATCGRLIAGTTTVKILSASFTLKASSCFPR